MFAFINQPDPFEVTSGERTLQEGERSLQDETASRVIEPSENVITLVPETIVDNVEAAKASKAAGKKRVRVAVPSKQPEKKRLTSVSVKDVGSTAGMTCYVDLFF